MNQKEENFAELCRIYFSGDEQRNVLFQLSEENSYATLILKEHYRHGFKKKYFDRRHPFFRPINRFLEDVSIFELASMSGFIEGFSSSNIGVAISEALENIYFIAYYEECKSMALPQLFRLRCRGNKGIPVYPLTANVQAGFFSILEIDQIFREKIASNTYFQHDYHDEFMLDTFIRKIHRLSSHEHFFLGNLADHLSMDEGCLQLETINTINFFIELYNCLQFFSSFPILKSAVWHKYCFSVFGADRGLAGILKMFLENILNWHIGEEGSLCDDLYNYASSGFGVINKMSEDDNSVPIFSLLRRLKQVPENAFGDNT